MEIRPVKPGLGADYNTNWARTPPARFVRRVLTHLITKPGIRLLASPSITGLDRLEKINGPAIFIANHSGHIDTSAIISSLPSRFRNRMAVAARSDYIFDKLWKATMWSLWMNVIPIERNKASRKSIHIAEKVLSEGWSLIIYPEESRGEDDFAVPFKPGGAYLSIKNNVPVVPIHLEGTRRIFAPYTHRIHLGKIRVTFGEPLYPEPEERTNAFNRRIEQAVAACADERRTDWWSAKRRAANGTTPSLQAPPDLTGWRKAWGSSAYYEESKRQWP